MLRDILKALLLLIFAVACKSDVERRLSPIQLYGQGGRGVLTQNALNYGGVMDCFMQTADENHDGKLGFIELRTVTEQYLTSKERLFSGLYVDRIFKQCDRDGDKMVSYAELLMQPPCFSVPQAESIARYICSRAQHGDLGYAEYQAQFALVKAAAEEGRTMDMLREGIQKIDAKLEPFAGRMDRLENPGPTGRSLVGKKLGPELIIAGFAIIFIVILVAVAAAI